MLFDLNPIHEVATAKEKLIYSAKRSLVKFILLSLFLSIFLLGVPVIVSSDDLILFSRSLLHTVTMALVELKVVATFLKRNDIWNMLQELNAIYDERRRGSGDFKVKKYLDEYHFYIRIYATTFILTLFPIFYSAIPFILYGIMDNPITYWYPFDVESTASFAFSLVWTDFIAYKSTLCLLGCDSLLYTLITLITMELDAVYSDFVNLRNVPINEKVKEVKCLVDRQNKLLELCDTLQDIYGLAVFFSFFVSSFLLCFAIFQLTIATNNLVYTYTFYVPYMGLVIGQIFLLCAFGQKLIDSSELLAEGAYNCGWEDIDDIALKKKFILLILRANNCKRLTAMNFADISLSSFTSVRSSLYLPIS